MEQKSAAWLRANGYSVQPDKEELPDLFTGPFWHQWKPYKRSAALLAYREAKHMVPKFAGEAFKL